MEGHDLIEKISECVPITSKNYTGDLDDNGLRTKIGDETWSREYHQRYKGQFLQDSLHGRGVYSWTIADKKTVYEGMFYTSDLEGYGKFSYNDSSVFEGLFKTNRRFGPGVFTYTDGTQDVGMWMGTNLMRLCCVVKPEWVPRLAKTPTAKIKILKFRKLISVCNNPEDPAKLILEALEVNEEVMKQSNKLYNRHIRNPKSKFFNTTLHDKHYFSEKDCFIEVALSPEEEKTYYEEKALEKLERDVIFEEESGPIPLVTDNECSCDDPREIRLEEIRSELEHTESVLSRIAMQIRKARCQKKLAKQRSLEAYEDHRKSVGWEKVQIIGGSTTELQSDENNYEQEDPDDELLDDVECEFELEGEEEETDYETACKLLAAARSAERLLLHKKHDLINKLVYETTAPEKSKSEPDQRPIKKVLITDLLAWNNEETSTEMLKHVFLHRNFEKDLSYCIADLLAGDRGKFRQAGAYEGECIDFLSECSNGNVKEAKHLLLKHDLNPDLCDVKGNTGMIYAAARDKTKMIQTLVNFGANVDILNDECLTPLGLCIARYLAVQQKITDWEKAFLKTTSVDSKEEQEVLEWRPHVSLTSINNILQSKIDFSIENFVCPSTRSPSSTKLEALSELFGSNLDVITTNLASVSDLHQKLRKMQRLSQNLQEPYIQKITDETAQPYLLSTECVKPPPIKKKKEKKGKKEKKDKKSKSSKSSKGSKSKSSDKSSKKSDKGSKKGKKSKSPSPKETKKESLIENIEPSPEEILRTNRLTVIQDTILTLLKYGANPDVCEVPVPTLILAVFTKHSTLVENLLSYNADPNITTLEENLTALHVLVSLPPCEEYIEILKVLLRNSADPNRKAAITHWAEQKLELLAKHELIEEDEGKTPLHLLSMRYDFTFDTNDYLLQMVPIFMEYGGRMKQRYLGHTPLSLAIMRGNLKLIRCLLETKRVNPNQQLGEQMGVPLTLFILKRYKDILPDFEVCQEIFQLLLEFKANPFEDVEGMGNAVEFMFKEHEEPPKPDTKKKKGKGKKDKGKKKGGSKKGGKKGKKGKKDAQVQEEVKKLLLRSTKTVLEKHIKGYAIKYLYFFVEEEDYYDDISANMAKFVTPEEAVQIAQLLVFRGEIPINESTSYDIMYDLVEFLINVNSKSEKSDVPPSKGVDIDKMLENFEFKKLPRERGKLNLPEPETEEHREKYNFCFHCYKKKNLQLFICPECRLIYFCSQECNRLNNKEKPLVHKCGTLFYNQQKEIYQERLTRADHWQQAAESRKKLRELQKEKGWVVETANGADVGATRKEIPKNPKRKLHLTRDLRPPGGRPVPIKEVTQEKLDLLGRSDDESILSIRWRQEGSEFLQWKVKFPDKDEHQTRKKGKYEDIKEGGKSALRSVGKRARKTRSKSESSGSLIGKSGRAGSKKRSLSVNERPDVGENQKIKREKNGVGNKTGIDEGGKSATRSIGKGVGKTDKESRRSMSESPESGKLRKSRGTTGECRGISAKGEDRAESVKGKRSAKGEDRAESVKGKRSAKGEDRAESVKGKRRSDDEGTVTKGGKLGKSRGDSPGISTKSDGRRSVPKAKERGGDHGKTKLTERFLGGSKDKAGAANLVPVALGATKGLNSGLEGNKIIGYTPMPVGRGRMSEFKRRLPNKYQYFLEKISELWPEFDLSLLFLPYACYTEGQLYYKFVPNEPVFMKTYSHL